MYARIKRALCAALTLTCTAGLLIGCGSDKEESSKGSAKKVTLTFGSHQSGLPTTGTVQELAKDFEKETGIKVDFQISPDAQWKDLVRVKLNSGEAPDILCIDTPVHMTSSVRVDEYCVDLSDQEWVGRMEENAKKAVSVDGKTYGITFPGAKMYFYLYNKDIFADLGLEAPKTYEEFKNACKTIKEAGITPIYEATTNGWHQVLPLFETSGLWTKTDKNVFDKLNANEVMLEDMQSILTILEQMNECAQAGYFGEDYLSNAWENAGEAMASGKCAMTIAELGFRGQIEADYPDFKASEKLGAFVMPWGDNTGIGVKPAANAYFINKDSKYTEEAKQFFEFLARPENLEKRLEGQTNLNDLCWPEIKGRYTEEDQAYIDSLEKTTVAQSAVDYIDFQWMDIGKDMEAMFTGAMTPEDVLHALVERRNEQAKLQNDPGWSN